MTFAQDPKSCRTVWTRRVCAPLCLTLFSLLPGAPVLAQSGSTTITPSTSIPSTSIPSTGNAVRCPAGVCGLSWIKGVEVVVHYRAASPTLPVVDFFKVAPQADRPQFPANSFFGTPAADGVLERALSEKVERICRDVSIAPARAGSAQVESISDPVTKITLAKRINLKGTWRQLNDAATIRAGLKAGLVKAVRSRSPGAGCWTSEQ